MKMLAVNRVTRAIQRSTSSLRSKEPLARALPSRRSSKPASPHPQNADASAGTSARNPNSSQPRLAELRRFVTTQNARKLDHPHTLMGFRPAHPSPPEGTKRYRTDRALPNRTYRLLPTCTFCVLLGIKRGYASIGGASWTAALAASETEELTQCFSSRQRRSLALPNRQYSPPLASIASEFPLSLSTFRSNFLN